MSMDIFHKLYLGLILYSVQNFDSLIFILIVS